MSNAQARFEEARRRFLSARSQQEEDAAFAEMRHWESEGGQGFVAGVMHELAPPKPEPPPPRRKLSEIERIQAELDDLDRQQAELAAQHLRNLDAMRERWKREDEEAAREKEKAEQAKRTNA